MADTKPADTEAISKGTARSWNDWLAWLDGIGAGELSHSEIARRIVATGDASSWWAQAITVAFEQHIGRRKPGQRAGGGFEVSATRTLSGDVVWLFSALIARHAGAQALDGVALDGDPRTSVTPKRSYWRCRLSDGSGVQISLEGKAGSKVLVAATHDRLGSEEDIAPWRAFWKAELAAL